MTLNRKILLGFIACALVLATVTVFSFRNSEQFIESNEWVNHTHEVITEFRSLMILTVDAVTATRGYVITGNEDFLEPYVNARINIVEHVEKVRTLTQDNSVQ